MTQTIAISADTQSRDLVGNLALIYLRHAQPERALALGVSAMAMGLPTPELALTVSSAFLECKNPAQADALLTRFWSDEPLLDGEVTTTHLAAAHALSAKTAHRLGKSDEAKEHLRQAAELTQDEA